MRVLLLCGSRSGGPLLSLVAAWVSWAASHSWSIVCGDAEGVDEAVVAAASAAGVPLVVAAASSAGLRLALPPGVQSVVVPGGFLARDRWLVAQASFVACLWDGQSRGTYYVAQWAQRQGVPGVLLVPSQGRRFSWGFTPPE